MVYDASEGVGDPQAPGGAAYVVNEWIDGETLAERLQRGPLPQREARTVIRRLAEGVAEAHRVGLAVGGLTPEHVVIRPNGLVGLRAVPAARGTTQGDITALGALLRRARSTEPGQGLSSVAAMVALLNEPPRPRTAGHLERAADESDSGWLRRLRDRRPEGDLPPEPAMAPAPT